MFFKLANLTSAFNGALSTGANLAVKGMVASAFLSAASPKQEAAPGRPAPKLTLAQRFL